MKRLILLSFLLILTGTGCNTDQALTGKQPSNAPEWEFVAEDMHRLVHQYGDDAFTQLVLYRFEPHTFGITFDHGDPKLLSEWNREHLNSTLITNGTYFHEDFLPSGRLRINGENIGTRQFDLGRTGILQFGDTVRLRDFSQEGFNHEALDNWAQSYPFLIKGGIPAIKEDSFKVAPRTFVGTDTQKRFYLGVVPTSSISLFELGTLLTKLPVEWDRVLNLDGGPSTGLISAIDHFDTLTPVPNILIVYRNTRR